MQSLHNGLILCCAVLFLSACGYQLRQSVELPDEMKKMYVQNGSAPLRKRIRKVVKSSSANLAKTPEDAGMIVNILEEDMRRNVLSLSSTGKAIEYELYYTLAFELIDEQGKIVLPRQTIEVSRDYFNDQSGETVLGKASEEGVIREEMYKYAVRSIVDRARSVFKGPVTR